MTTDRTKAGTTTGAQLEAPGIDDYRDLVRRVMQDVSSGSRRMARTFANTGAAHARVVLDTMMANAHDRVDIFSRELGNAVWDPAWFGTMGDRAPDVRLRVLVDNDGRLDESHSAIPAVMRAGGRIEVRRCQSMPKTPAHFTVVDGRHVRLERDHATKKAVVAFGVEDVGTTASETFETLWKHAVPVAAQG